MRSTRLTLLKAFVIVGLLFGFMGVLTATPAAAQEDTVCQYNFDTDGNLINSNLQPSAEACSALFASSTTCQVGDSNGDGAPDWVSGSGCVFELDSGIACMIADNDGDGNIDFIKGNCNQVVPTPTPVPPTEVPPTEVPPTEAPPTEAPPTEAPPTEAPPTKTPGENGAKTPTHEPGQAEPTEKDKEHVLLPGKATETPVVVAELPSTGSGDTVGSVWSTATVLGAVSVMLLAVAAIWQRRQVR